MKIAIYIENGITQLVLTPENDWEKSSIQGIQKGQKLEVYRGCFYGCLGGWMRHGENNDSLILRMDAEPLSSEL
jgi:hypothetical protein